MTLLLRRWPVPVLGVLVLTTQVLVLRNRDASWVGDPLWGQETIGVAQVLVLPLVAGAAAVEGWRARTGLLSLLPQNRPRRCHVVRHVLATSTPSLAAFLVANLGVLLASARAQPRLANASPWPLMSQLVAVVVATSVGYSVGYVVRSWAGTVVAAVGVGAWVLLDRMGIIVSGLAEYASSGSMIGATASSRYFLLRLVWMALVVATALMVVLPVGGSWRWLGPAVACVLGGQLLFSVNQSYDWSAHDRQYCTTGQPRVCGPTMLADRVDEAGLVVRQTARVLAAAGVRSKDQYVMWSPGVDKDDWVMLVDPMMLRAPLDRRRVVETVVAPQSCPQWHAAEPPPLSFFAAQRLVAAVVERGMGMAADEAVLRKFERSVPASRRSSVLLAAGNALQSCDAVPDELTPVLQP